MERLRSSTQFERVRKEGRTWGSSLLVLNVAANADGVVRCGFITGKKIGKAVQRNRAKRLIREAMRLRLPYVNPGYDLVWIARAAIGGATLWDVLAAVDNLLKRSRTLKVRELPAALTEPQQKSGDHV